MSTARAERPKPFWRSVGYLLFSLAWALVLLLTTAAFWLAVWRVAQGAVGPFNATPIGGVVVVVVLGAPLLGYTFFLSPLLTATQAALGLVLLRESLGSKDADPPVAVNTGHRIPILAPAHPTELTRRLVRIGEQARVPPPLVLLAVFALGAVFIATVVAIGWT